MLAGEAPVLPGKTPVTAVRTASSAFINVRPIALPPMSAYIDSQNLLGQVCIDALGWAVEDRGGRTGAAALPIFACIAAGSLYGWSGYLPSVREAFTASNADVSTIFSIAITSFTLGVLFGPAFMGRVGMRFRLTAISGTASASLLLACASHSLTAFVLVYGLGFGIASDAIYNHALTVAAQSACASWLIPLSVAAFGIGGLCLGR